MNLFIVIDEREEFGLGRFDDRLRNSLNEDKRWISSGDKVVVLVVVEAQREKKEI
jgi:hypothetical protein